MAVCRNGFLRYGDGVTYRALLTLGKTCFGTGRCYGIESFLGVAVCRNGFLRYGNGVTYRTLLTLGKTCFGTGRRYGVESFLCVAVCRNGFLRYGNGVTYGALLTRGKTCFGTGGRYGIEFFLGVRNLFDILGVAIAAGASKGLNACCGTSRSFSYLLTVFVGVCGICGCVFDSNHIFDLVNVFTTRNSYSKSAD